MIEGLAQNQSVGHVGIKKVEQLSRDMPLRRLERQTGGESIGEGGCCNAAGAQPTRPLAAGLAPPPASWLTLLPPAGRYFGLRADAATVQPEPGERPAANAARIEQSGDRAKLIFELSAPLDAAAFVLADPDRVIVDLPQTDFALAPETGKAADPPHRKSVLIASLRFGQTAPGKARIVIDLGAPALVLRASCDKLDSDGHARRV